MVWEGLGAGLLEWGKVCGVWEKGIILRSYLKIASFYLSSSCLSIGRKLERICVCGHTPVQHLPQNRGRKMDEIKPVMYQGTDIPELSGWKIDMDTGVVSSGRMWVRG